MNVIRVYCAFSYGAYRYEGVTVPEGKTIGECLKAKDKFIVRYLDEERKEWRTI